MFRLKAIIFCGLFVACCGFQGAEIYSISEYVKRKGDLIGDVVILRGYFLRDPSGALSIYKDKSHWSPEYFTTEPAYIFDVGIGADRVFFVGEGDEEKCLDHYVEVLGKIGARNLSENLTVVGITKLIRIEYFEDGDFTRSKGLCFER